MSVFLRDRKMQKERLIIKNFFTLKDVDIELGKYNVFIGEQASGKSLILKLIYICHDLLTLPIEANIVDIDKINKFMQKYLIETIHLTNAVINDKCIIEYYVNDNYYFKITWNDLPKIQYSQALYDLFIAHNHEQLELAEVSKNLTNNLSFSIASVECATKYLQKLGVKYDYSPLFIPAGRTFLVSLQQVLFKLMNFVTEENKLDKLILEFGQKYVNAIENFGRNNLELLSKLNKFDQKKLEFYDKEFTKILKGKFIYDGLGGYIQHEGYNVKPWNSSSGQQETLPIYLVLRNYLIKNSGLRLYIEEPEAHLYPSAQKAITELLVYVTNATNSDGLYITTHSPYILTVLNNLILAHDVKDKQTLFDKDLLVPFEEVRAYYIADGTARDLRDTENRLILADNLDKVSEQTALDFDKLLDLKYE